MGKELLLIDGVVNLLLGIVLLSYPKALARAFGLPSDGGPFFALILGGVLFGVGLALIIERYRPPLRVVGLGLGGAVAINLCGAVVLIGWLLVGQPTLTELGRLSLWVLVVLLLGLSAFELYAHLRRAEE